LAALLIVGGCIIARADFDEDTTGVAVGIESLTPRETEVLELLARALTYEEIAAELEISIKTVENHVCMIFRKLGVHRRTEAARIWWEHQHGLGGGDSTLSPEAG
jgi:DNA-binding NarL/FixJ family response regulator